VEGMILRKLEERTWHEERDYKLWPAMFCLGEFLWAGASRVSTWRCEYYQIGMESFMNNNRSNNFLKEGDYHEVDKIRPSS
jgi:hypothetical protein